MSKKKSILKSQESNNSPNEKKISLDNKNILEFPDVKGLESVISSFLNPIFEENKSSQRIQRNSFNSQMNINNISLEVEVPCLKPLEWSLSTPKTIKKTPKEIPVYERLLKETNEKNQQNENECKTIKAQVEKYININNLNKESIKNYNKQSALYRKFETNYKKSVENNFNHSIMYSNYINDKYLIDLNKKNHWTELINMNNKKGEIYRHTTTIIDNPLYSSLVLKILSNKTFLYLTTELPCKNLSKIWEKLKIFIENCSVGSKKRALNKACSMWCSFVKFTQSYQKLALISDNISIEVKDYIVIISGNILKKTYKVEILFANIDDDWDISTNAFNQVRL
ncbi:hypothetical protein SteCoe_15479 [Stentor coeruleus]|uniref:Uncharacterized protein n=1 Tax=Stentor coeruleus TaxID=5963 RepID=A0A1R2C3L7_9CILI|nr:hypothetical protein SteCoe_15479 [Stentor coeruleus]